MRRQNEAAIISMKRAGILIAAVTAVILLVAGFVLIRRSSWWKPKVQTARYLHQHLPASEWEPTATLTTDPYTMREGDTLASLARRRYGHQKYSGVIKLYNHIENESAVPAGATLRLPDMSTVLTEEGLSRVAASEMEMILCARAKYAKVESQLWELSDRPSGERVTVPQNVKQELMEAADDLEQATESLKTNRPGTTRPPAKMIGQLESAMYGMRQLAQGTIDDNGYDIDMVQQRYGLGLTYGIIWAREGFN
jgi:phage tail protein X